MFKFFYPIKNISSVVRFLTLTDFLMSGGFGLLAPIFAVFITENIQQSNVEVVGIATAIFLLTKSLCQIIVGVYIDKIKGERDDFTFLLAGGLVYSLVPLLYIFINTPLELYGVQFIYGLAAAFMYPSWMAIFTRHVDKSREGVEWSMYATFVEVSMAITASLGGFIAFQYGFKLLFITASVIIFLGNLFVIMIFNKIRKHS